MVVSLPQERRLLKLHLTGLGRLGEALAEADGKPVFVFGGIPGETVVAEVIRERRGHIAARVVEVEEPSPDRVAPPCSYFGECTGCQWQHVRYERQLEMKREAVLDALERIGGITEVAVEPALPSPQQLGYRNHARFTVSREGGRLGFVNRETHRHVEVAECLLMSPWINGALADLQGHVADTTQLSLRHGVNTGSWLLQPTFHSPGVPMAGGQKSYQERLNGHEFQVSSPSFFQVNTPQAERMAELVADALALTGRETVVDAYAGVGVFAVLLADRAKRVVAIEESAPALADAKVNTSSVPNVELRKGRTEDLLVELVGEGVDAVVLDPPRAGCLPGTLEALLAAPPKRIAYVSCDPETLARDLKVLTAGPFRIERVQPVDMFPQTHHVECLVTLSLDENRRRALETRQHIVLASGSPRRIDILSRLGLEAEAAPTDVAEPKADGNALAVAAARAMAKARAAADRRSSGTVVGADTVVELAGELLGKPHDADEAAAMLRRLRGREHRVLTAVALVDASVDEAIEGYRATRVRMREYTDEEIAAYVASGDPMDKAGAYAVQSEDFHPAAEVWGCYLNVVGMPVCTLLKLAEAFGLRLDLPDSLPWPELERCPQCAKRAAKHRASARRTAPNRMRN